MSVLSSGRENDSRHRRFLGLVVLLGLGKAVAYAGPVTLRWDYPVTLQPQALWMLNQTTVTNGQTRLVRTVLTPLDGPACAQATGPHTPDVDAWGTWGPVCADICRDPGDYKLTVHAVIAGKTTGPSNELELDLQGVAYCTPPLPPLPPTSQPSSPIQDLPPAAPIAVGIGVYVAYMKTPPPVPPLPALPNLGCVHWAIVGPCVCGFPPHPCATVSYWEPGWLIETVLKPGTTVVAALGPVLDAVLKAGGLPGGAGGGASKGAGTAQTTMQYAEAHVYTFPQLLGGPCTACAPTSAAPVLHYASELDAATWRTAKTLPAPVQALFPVGVWGGLYPRGGRVIHTSQPVASGLQAVRALDIARQPIGTPPHLDAHVITHPVDASSTCLQLAYPRRLPCFTAGMPPPLWDHGVLSPRGTYIWLAWRKRTCCVELNQTTCGLTIPGIGTHGENLCVLPSTP